MVEEDNYHTNGVRESILLLKMFPTVERHKSEAPFLYIHIMNRYNTQKNLPHIDCFKYPFFLGSLLIFIALFMRAFYWPHTNILM